VRAITIAQPLASATILGGRKVHNGRRIADISSDGLLLAVHAGSKYWSPGGKQTSKLSHEAIRFCVDRWHGYPVDLSEPDECYRGAILGVVRVRACVDLSAARAKSEACAALTGEEIAVLCSRWAEGPYCWLIDHVWILPEPIFCRGSLSLWVLDEAAERALAADMATNEGMSV
jgi:hypothetical protein